MASKRDTPKQGKSSVPRYYDTLEDMKKDHKHCVDCTWRDKSVKEKVYCTRVTCVRKR